MGGMVVIREVSPDDWEILRDVRLAALREAPAAFGSTYAREAAFTEERWRGRISERHGVTYFAYRPQAPEPAGLIGVYVEDGLADVVSMWVRPGARGSGVGEALITAAADWSRARGHDGVFLWVTESNTARPQALRALRIRAHRRGAAASLGPDADRGPDAPPAPLAVRAGDPPPSPSQRLHGAQRQEEVDAIRQGRQVAAGERLDPADPVAHGVDVHVHPRRAG